MDVGVAEAMPVVVKTTAGGMAKTEVAAVAETKAYPLRIRPITAGRTPMMTRKRLRPHWKRRQSKRTTTTRTGKRTGRNPSRSESLQEKVPDWGKAESEMESQA